MKSHFKGSETGKRRSVETLGAAAALVLSLAVASAATNDLTTTLQKGLFEEEANHNLGAAIQLYQSVVSRFDTDRKLAATAVFRLAECYRKQGNTNEANAQYDRVLREFADQTQLVTLSRQNLAALGGGTPTAPASATVANPGAPEAAQARAEAAAIKTKLDVFSKMNAAELRLAIQQEYPNPVLTSLIQKLTESEQNLAAMQKEFGPNYPKVVEETTRIKTIENQIGDQVRAVRNGLEAKRKEAEARAEALAQSGAASPGQAETAARASTAAETEEVRRIQAMIKDSPDLINASPDKGLAPLNEAASQGHLAVAQFLLDHGADVGVKNPRNEWTPLHFAADNGHKAIVELLLSHKARVNAIERAGKTPLHFAAEKGYRSVIEVLLEHGADVNARDNNGATPLHYAIGNGFRSISELLLVKGADPNVKARNVIAAGRNMSGTTLHIAADRGDLGLMELLLANKADPNAINANGSTPLDLAAGSGRVALAEYLLAHGADVNQKNQNSNQQGWTALHYAVEQNQKDMVDLLLRNKADPNAAMETGSFGGRVPLNPPETLGYTPLLMACAEGYSNIVASLLEAKADPNLQATKAGGDLPIFSTMERVLQPTRAGIISLLLNHGANPEARNERGKTPLLEAAERNDKDSLKLLLAAKADPNAKSAYSGQTALHYLALSPYRAQGSISLVPGMAQDLIAAGTDVNMQDNNGKTPLNYINEWLGRQINAATPGSPPPGMLPSRIGSEPSYLESVRALSEVLRKAGAVEDLARMDVIQISRRSAKFSQVVFSKGTNDYNHFTLYELIAAHYGFIEGDPRGLGDPRGFGGNPPVFDPVSHTLQSSLRFPDVTHVVIRRPKPDRTQWTTRAVNLAQLFEKDWNLGTYRTPCSDETLHWGDVIELPEADHPINAGWQGLPEKDLGVLHHCLSRQVQLTVKGSTTNIVLRPAVEAPGRMATPGGPIVPNFYLRNVLYRSGMLRASSDVSRVKVSRRDSASGQRYEMVFDCSANRPIDTSSELWLRDGDVIEVPEKEGS